MCVSLFEVLFTLLLSRKWEFFVVVVVLSNDSGYMRGNFLPDNLL